MNVIAKSSHNITFSSNHISGKRNSMVPNCDITNHITLQSTIASPNKVYAIGKNDVVRMVVTCDVTFLRKLFRWITTLGFFPVHPATH